MAVLRHPETGEEQEVEGEIPVSATYMVEGYDEEQDEFWQEVRVDLEGESWEVVDDGADYQTLG